MPAISASLGANWEGSWMLAPIRRAESSGFGNVPSAACVAPGVVGAAVGTGVAAHVQAASAKLAAASTGSNLDRIVILLLLPCRYGPAGQAPPARDTRGMYTTGCVVVTRAAGRIAFRGGSSGPVAEASWKPATSPRERPRERPREQPASSP